MSSQELTNSGNTAVAIQNNAIPLVASPRCRSPTPIVGSRQGGGVTPSRQHGVGEAVTGTETWPGLSKPHCPIAVDLSTFRTTVWAHMDMRKTGRLLQDDFEERLSVLHLETSKNVRPKKFAS